MCDFPHTIYQEWAEKTDHIEELPRLETFQADDVDSRYALAFDCSDVSNIPVEEIYQHFNEYGFVIVKNIYDETQCENTRKAMWEILGKENPGVERDNPQTWTKLKGKGRYGLSIRGPSFHSTLLDNRQNPKLVKVLSALTESRQETNLIVSQDRFTVYRPTKYEDESIPGESFSTGDRNLHLDLNPWWWEENAHEVLDGIEKTLHYKDDQDFIKENNLVVSSMGRHVQCVLNFADNLEEDGGTILIPYFHRYLRAWNRRYAQLKKPLPWVSLPKKVEEELLVYAHRLPMREGSVLIWDQRVLHGTAPNRSYRCRMAQYLKAFPRDLTFPAPDEKGSQVVNPRLLKRSQAVADILKRDGSMSLVTEVGKFVFGLDILPETNPVTNDEVK